MKLNGILGKGSGKLGSSVFAISGGEQVVREYNPNVTNPNTSAQVDQRAKFKLMSQLAADLASVIVIPKSGLVSARNQFVSKNIALATAENGEASINYVNVQLTASEAAFPAVTGSIDASGNLGVELTKMPAADVQKVVYCVFAKDETNQLSLIGSTIIDRSEATNNFAYTFEGASDAFVVYAYGIKASAVAANTNYDNYEIEGATDIARLVAARSISLDASGTTRTSGALVAAGVVAINAIDYKDPSDGTERVFVPSNVAGPIVLSNGKLLTSYLEDADDFGENPSADLRFKEGDNVHTQALVLSEGVQGGITWEFPDAGEYTNAYLLGLTITGEGKVASIAFKQP